MSFKVRRPSMASTTVRTPGFSDQNIDWGERRDRHVPAATRAGRRQGVGPRAFASRRVAANASTLSTLPRPLSFETR